VVVDARVAAVPAATQVASDFNNPEQEPLPNSATTSAAAAALGVPEVSFNMPESEAIEVEFNEVAFRNLASLPTAAVVAFVPN
jgi:hypothetical protein